MEQRDPNLAPEATAQEVPIERRRPASEIMAEASTILETSTRLTAVLPSKFGARSRPDNTIATLRSQLDQLLAAERMRQRQAEVDAEAANLRRLIIELGEEPRA